jgi:hypothetical protein
VAYKHLSTLGEQSQTGGVAMLPLVGRHPFFVDSIYPSGEDKIALRLALPPGLLWRSWCHLRVRPLDAPPVPCQQKLFERLTTRSASSVKLAIYIDQGEGGGVPCKLRFCAFSNNFRRFSAVVESYDYMLDNRGSNPIGDFLLQT